MKLSNPSKSISLALWALTVIGFFSVSGCDEPGKKEDQKPSHTAAPVEKDAPFDSFLQNLRKAVNRRDLQAIGRLMTEDFGYRWDSAPVGEGVFAYWDQQDIWGELEHVLAQPFTQMDEFRVSPRAFAQNPNGFDGWRAGMIQVRGVWRFAYFVPAPAAGQ
jgi:hypothetical protein